MGTVAVMQRPALGTANNLTHDWIRPGDLVRVAGCDRFEMGGNLPPHFSFTIVLLKKDFSEDPRRISYEGAGYSELEPVMRPKLGDDE